MPLTKGQWTQDQDRQIGAAHRFVVTVSNFGTLGAWSKVEGLGFSISHDPWTEAGINTYTSVLLGRPKWTDIRLTRAVITGEEQWKNTLDFVNRSLTAPMSASSSRGSGDSLTIDIQTAWGDLVRSMVFTGARLVQWQGPTLTAGKGDVATEQLTFYHEGLFPSGSLER